MKSPKRLRTQAAMPREFVTSQKQRIALQKGSQIIVALLGAAASDQDFWLWGAKRRKAQLHAGQQTPGAHPKLMA